MKWQSFILVFLFCAASLRSQTADTLEIHCVASPPLIDGKGTDAVWSSLPWQSLSYVWIPYGGTIDSHSFSGRYKVCWCDQSNRLYFLIEVSDDVFVDGYVFGQQPDIYNFDIAEVFIDEDVSGGLHVFDGNGTSTNAWGVNAENAFTYHIYAPFPNEEAITRRPVVTDLSGTSWDDVRLKDYSSHLPEFALRRKGNVATWEFSLIVYDSTYKSQHQQNREVKLVPGKIMGLSVAYCDNDAHDGIRDAMFGSDWEPAPGNLHWMNADYFRKARLIKQ